LDLHLVHLEDIEPASEQVGTQLRQIREVYEPFRAQGRIILKGNKVDRDEAVQQILRSNTELLTEVQSAAALIRAEIESRGDFVSRVQSVAFMLGILLTLGLMVVARVLIIQPLAQLNEASNAMSRGEVIQPIAVDGPDEIRELGSSFERLRVSMRNFLGASASGGSL
jgi:nitrate/nitrite-specific signal transduction histidine kinase